MGAYCPIGVDDECSSDCVISNSLRLLFSMKKLFCLTAVVVSLSLTMHSQDSWSPNESQSADLARNLADWSSVEKDVLLHTNLVRLYPQKYLRLVVETWEMPKRYTKLDKSTSYYRGLLRELMRIRPTHALVPNSKLRELALCFAKAQGAAGDTGHNRSGTGCPKVNTVARGWAENCDYGMNSGEDIVMHLLIDEDVPSLGHRQSILNPEYFSIGIGHASHARFGSMTVQDFSMQER